MNCSESLDLLQDRLDGLPPADGNGLDRHLAECAPCREWYAAATRLEEGLALLSPPVSSPLFTQRIVQTVRADRQKQRSQAWQRVRYALTMAASLFLVLVVGDQLRRETNPQPVPLPKPVAVASLRQSMEEAGSAVANLTRKTADEALDHGKLLLDVVGVPMPPESALPPSPIEPSVRSLAVAGQAISTGLEPVANSAKRAWDLLLRDVPMPSEDKPGL